MGRSACRISDDPQSRGDLDPSARFQPGGVCEYEVTRTDQGVVHHERLWDAAGELIADQGVPVDYAIGSGTRGTSYLIDRGGLLFLSPISWYTQSGQWDLSPGYRPDDPLRFDRRVTDDCLACHVGQANRLTSADNRFLSPPFSELAIGCENCHGPGRDHVQFQSSVQPPGSRDPIVNPAKLEALERESVCNQCHLQGIRIWRPGTGPFEFRPGDNLEEHLVTLLEARSDGDPGSTKSVSQVQQMHDSLCFQRSERRMGCTSCHDPHARPSAEERVGFYRQKCLACHEAAPCSVPEDDRRRDSSEDSCIQCHMPRQSTRDVAHTSQSDHRIIRPGRAIPGERAEALTFFNQAQTRLPDWERERVLGLAALRRYQQSGRPAFLAEVRARLEPLSSRSAADLPVLRALGAVAMAQGRYAEARIQYERVLSQRADDEESLMGLLQAAYRTGDYQAGLEAAARLLQVNPSSAEVYAVQAQMLKVMGKVPEAIASAEQAAKRNPRDPRMPRWLRDTARETGRVDEARLYEALLVRLQGARPRTPPTPAAGVGGNP